MLLNNSVLSGGVPQEVSIHPYIEQYSGRRKMFWAANGYASIEFM